MSQLHKTISQSLEDSKASSPRSSHVQDELTELSHEILKAKQVRVQRILREAEEARLKGRKVQQAGRATGPPAWRPASTASAEPPPVLAPHGASVAPTASRGTAEVEKQNEQAERVDALRQQFANMDTAELEILLEHTEREIHASAAERVAETVLQNAVIGSPKSKPARTMGAQGQTSGTEVHAGATESEARLLTHKTM